MATILIFPTNNGIASLPELIQSYPDEWEESGLSDDDQNLPGRAPTWDEVNRILQTTAGYITDELWPGVITTSEGSTLTIEMPYQNQHGEIEPYHASGDIEELVRILQKLPVACGIFFIMIEGDPLAFVKAEGG